MRHLYRHILLLVAILMIFLMHTPSLYATTWDLTNDYSTSQNPNGTWSYGWEAVGGGTGTFNLYSTTFFGTGGIPVWGEYNGPNLGKNTSSYPVNNVQPGEVTLHPGPSGQYSVARWTSPVTGTITISGWFGAGDNGIMSYFIYQNGTEIWADRSTYSDGTFSLSEAVSIGSTIDFAVGGGYGYGSTPLHATIVPLPGAVLLLGSGLMGLAGWRRFRRS